MASYQGLVDQYGRPIEKKLLTQEIAAATLAGTRSPITGYPSNGLNPGRLGTILREADAGNPLRYFELAEAIEERDPHYLGVLSTRKRSVTQLPITVEEAGPSQLQKDQAQMVRDWIERDELTGDLFDQADAIGKGVSFLEIIWDTSSGQWMPQRLEWRDPRWFRFNRHDGTTPLLIGASGEETELPAGKFVRTVIRAKSGLPVRSGIARVATWAWMFKAFTNRDWQIFVQNYGQPVRIGKYGPGASDADRNTLLRAVSNIAGDCAAIIPESMTIDFVESRNVSSGTDLHLKRIDHLDQQISKLVLGQTATTDAIAGGHAVGQEHRQVQEDIERADCKDLAVHLNRDLVRVWIDLEYGPPADGKYPRLRIGREEDTDVKLTVDSVATLVPLGLKVGQKQMRDVIGLGAPEDGDELLAARPSPQPPLPGAQPGILPNTQNQLPALQQQRDATVTAQDLITQGMADAAAPAGEALLEAVRHVLDQAHSLEEVRIMLEAMRPSLSAADLAVAMRQALVLAQLTGRAEIA